MLGILGVASTGLTHTIPHLLIAVLGATSADIIFAALERRKPYFPSSAILSGLIVGFILVPIEPQLITFAVGALASITKHLLRIERGHIFNPAALALVLSVPIFNTGQSWWGALSNLPGIFAIIVLALGIAILSRVNKFPMAISFLGAYFGLFSIVGIADPTRVAEMFRVPFINAAIFLAGFMLTDPPTSPGRLNDQIWIGGLVATISVVAQLAGAGQSYLLIGILGGNLALVVSRWLRHNGQLLSP